MRWWRRSGAAEDPPVPCPSGAPHEIPDGTVRGVEERRVAGLSSRTWTFLAAALTATVVVAGGNLIHPPYILFRPGPVYDTLGEINGKPVIEVKGRQTYGASGELSFTTVALYGGRDREITLWEYLVARLQPGTEIRPVAEVYPRNVTRQQIRQQTQAQMADAQAEAKVVAMRAAGLQVPEKVTVAAVLEDGPSAKTLVKGDQIVSMEGKALPGGAPLRARIQELKDDETLSLVVLRAGKEVPVSVSSTAKDGRRLIGVVLSSAFDFPVEVSIHAGDVGGSSAGLMFSLGLYDRLTPGELTGGRRIAGTGTIAGNGAVGAIGGIQHKMRGARETKDAEWFLSPEANCSAVQGNIPDGLRVVKVATFEAAKHAVEEIAAGRGDALPGC
ncbi:PDZ domain-containing protein [Austwickia chelonae]|uniref:PDZ domain-containing protein n=1 Tax=Austwickia chelonae NBRC 105200 TaxID=1184607 RepID=K6VSI5_9MICO|nr:PDZ domain-containing protein [Austwickia chelonae]GAB78305.1 hypothetical protein AUCHE_08_05510 [Austwickia chelonae NBRC 105200]SEW00878.1 PDZ domain-containing protein [Austwickia chelonae]